MPHQCTACGHVFEDGSKEMLSGCPECGGAKFQFHPEGTEIPDEPPDASPPEPETGGVADRVGRATTTVRDWVSGDGRSGAGTESADASPGESVGSHDGDAPDPDAAWPDAPGAGDDASDDDIIDADAVEPAGDDSEPEDLAQASARRDVAAPGDLPDTDPGDRPDVPSTDAPAPSDDDAIASPEDDQPGIEELRAELNDQFESIRIVEPGQYELNLMELYDREEYVVALQENGRYVIQMPDDWLGPPDEPD